MHTLFDTLQADKQPLLTRAREARCLAIEADQHEDSYEALDALLRAQCAALDAGQFKAWLALVQDGAADPRFDAAARGTFSLVLESVCETEALPDGGVHQLIAIPLTADGPDALWELDLPDDVAARVEALYKRQGLVAADARMTVLPAILQPGVAAALSPSAVFYLTRLLAAGDTAAAFEVIDSDVDEFEATAELVQDGRVLSGGVLLAVVTGQEDGLFPLEQPYWEALQALQDLEDGANHAEGVALTQEQVALAAREVQGLRNAADEAARTAAAELATLLGVTYVDVLSGPGEFYRAVEDVLARCRLLETVSVVGNAAIAHAGGERSRLTIGAELEARPDGRPGFLVALQVDGVEVAGFIWSALPGESPEESLEALAVVLDHAGVTGAVADAPAGELAGEPA